jgi:hypothetical protein
MDIAKGDQSQEVVLILDKPNYEIPGTIIFDGTQAMKGYALNKMRRLSLRREQ